MRRFRPSSMFADVAASSGVAFRILTYNLLADRFASSEWLGLSEDLLSWEHRRPKLLKEIFESGYNADILALQETERPFIEGVLGDRLRDHGYQVRCVDLSALNAKPSPSIVIRGITNKARSSRASVA